MKQQQPCPACGTLMEPEVLAQKAATPGPTKVAQPMTPVWKCPRCEYQLKPGYGTAADIDLMTREG